MLTKGKILQELLNAKIAHMRWVNRADHLISGLPVDKEFIPLEATSCGFGRWFYGPVGQELRAHDDFYDLMEQIELYHDDLHKVYAEIYKIFFVMPQQRSLIVKILTLKGNKVTDKERARAKELFASLQHASEKLLQLLEKLEERVKQSRLSVPASRPTSLKRA